MEPYKERHPVRYIKVRVIGIVSPLQMGYSTFTHTQLVATSKKKQYGDGVAVRIFVKLSFLA
jgi:hypothetical protein